MPGNRGSPFDASRCDGAWPASGTACGDSTLHAIERASVLTVAYADVFDYPLTAQELHRYLVGTCATPETIDDALRPGGFAARYLSRSDGYLTLCGREDLIEHRRRRAAVATQLWPRAQRYGSAIASLPFVRLVAVSGALALDNVEADADIDYFIVTEPDRLWLCRASVITLVRLAARQGVTICPNYFLSERALTLHEQDLFAAHELAQMVPIGDLGLYNRVRELNGWTTAFLPNAEGVPRHVAGGPRRGVVACRLAERVARTRGGRWLEQWEMTRKVRKFGRRANDGYEASFCADWCKGHFEGHGRRVLAAFSERLRALELAP